jgi:hypothetical protein
LDGRLPPEAVADFYKDAGYDFLALTDHFWESCGYPIVDTRPLRTKNFTTLIGAEIHAPSPPGIRLAHRRPRPALRLCAAGVADDAGHVPARSGRRRLPSASLHPQWCGHRRGCAVDPRGARGRGLQPRLRGGVRPRRRLVVHEEALARGALNAYAADDAHFGTPDAGGGWVMVKAEALEPERSWRP